MAAIDQPSQIQPGAMVTREGNEIVRLLYTAIEKGVGVEQLEKLVALQERFAEKQAEREFFGALAEFQAACPPIPKESTASIVSATKGTKFSYDYAELDTIATKVRPHLHPKGFSYSWDCKFADNVITATCTLRHVEGHSISAQFPAPIDTSSAMNVSQRYAAALSYAKRQSLIQVLGITTTEPDLDGGTGDPSTISAEQAANLKALMDEVKIDRAKFLIYLRVATIEELPARQYAMALSALEAKRRAT